MTPNAETTNAEIIEVPIYSLGQLGKVVKIPILDDITTIEKTQTQTKLIVIMDRSGSMGINTKLIVNDVLPPIAENLGYQQSDTITLITFDTISELYHLKVSELARTRMGCRGLTNMSGVPKLLEGELNQNDISSVNLLVISDGQLNDLDKAVNLVKEMSTRIDKSIMINTCLIRLMTGGQPSTRALSCFGCLSTTGEVNVSDINTPETVYIGFNSYTRKKNITDETVVLHLGTTIANAFEGSTCNQVVKVKSSAELKRFPGESGKTTLNLNPKRETFFLLENVTTEDDLSKLNITIGNQVIKLIDMGNVSNEEYILPFLQHCENHLKMLTVMGAESQEKLTGVINWFEKVENFMEISNPNDEPENVSISVRDRMHLIKTRIQKRHKSVLGRIMQLKNLDTVSGLNAQQQADFLRGVTNNRTGRAVAKRTNKTHDGEFNAEELARMDIQKFTGQVPPEPNNAEVSFYSKESAASFLEVIPEIKPDVQHMSAGDILTLIGGLGVAIKSYPGNYPDPWAFRVSKVYPGIYMGESDFWTAFTQSGQADNFKMKVPGQPGAVMTGVVPLRDLDRVSYHVYSKNFHNIANLQASVTMRRILADVPYDRLARDTATCFCLAQQIGETRRHQNQPLTIDLRTFKMLTENLNIALTGYAKNSMTDLADALLNSPDPRQKLTGLNNIGNVLKPICLLLGHPDNQKMFRPEVMRALYIFETYQYISKVLKQAQSQPDQNQAVPAIQPVQIQPPQNNNLNYQSDWSNYSSDYDSGYDSDYYHNHNRNQNQAQNNQNLIQNLDLNDQELFENILGINFPNHQTPLRPLFDPEPGNEALTHYSNFSPAVALERLQTYLFHKSLPTLNQYYIWSHVVINQNQPHNQNLTDFFGIQCTPELYQLGVLIQMMQCRQEFRYTLNSLIDWTGSDSNETLRLKLPELLTTDAITNWIQTTVKNIYRRDYETRLAEKKKTEARLKLAELIQFLVTCTDDNQFLTRLQEIESRSAPGYGDLEAQLLSETIGVPNRLMKLWTIVLGRDLEGNPTWNKGNVRVGNLDSFHYHFISANGHDQWDKLLAIKKQYGIHKYRDKPNNNGHGNEKPSYWAYGYISLKEFQENVTEEEFKRYATIHTNCCGFRNGPQRRSIK